jgi:hypothetical protein
MRFTFADRVRDMKVEASAIQAQNGRHLSILVRKARGPLVGQDGILRPIGTRPFRRRNGAWRHTAHAIRGGLPTVANPPQDAILPYSRAGDSTFMSRLTGQCFESFTPRSDVWKPI